jgi:hypothetical protein
MITTPRIFWRVFTRTKLFSVLPDKWALKIIYRNIFFKKLNLKNPKTFNEKLQWLKLYNRKPEYTIMADKYKVREYIKEKIGEEYLIPLLGVWEKADDIDFNSLPQQFVLKCNHGSGCNIICKDKSSLNIEETVCQLNQWMNKDFYKIGREWPYKNIPRRIIAEKYMVDNEKVSQYIGDTDDNAINDYKFFCFDGEPKALFVATDRGIDTRFDFFDMDFNHLPFKQGHPLAEKIIKKPDCFDEMVAFAKKLSFGIPQVRVDFYSINGQVYFGELTFYHYSGFTQFEPEEWDTKFGEWIKLPQKG